MFLDNWHPLSETTVLLDIIVQPYKCFHLSEEFHCGIILKNNVLLILLRKQKSQIIIQFHVRTVSKLVNAIFF